MKPLEFKYKKLIEHDTLDVVAYQVFPKGDYERLNGFFAFKARMKGSFSNRWFYVDANCWEQFKQAVKEYNKKYCEQPDVKVFDRFLEYVQSKPSSVPEYCRDLVTEYRQTLEPDYFEEIHGQA